MGNLRLAGLVLWALAFLCALIAAPALVQSTRGATPPYVRDITLELPPEPILPGDLLTLHGKGRFKRRKLRNLTFLVGRIEPAEVIPIDSSTVQIVVPPFVPAGPQPVLVIKHATTIVFSQDIPIGEIQAVAVGESDGVSFQWGLHFADATTFAVGSPVSGWVWTEGLSTVEGTSAPVSIAGTITANVDGALSLSLMSDTDGVEGRLVLGYLNLSTGSFFADIFSPQDTVQIEGDATLSVTTTPSRDIWPKISSVSPKDAKPGENITITGVGFGNTQGESTVTFAGKPVIDFPSVLSWSDTEIKARLAEFDRGSGPIQVTVGGVPSNPFTIVASPPCRAAVPEFVERFVLSNADLARSVRQTADCGFILAGETASFGFGDQDAYLAKTAANGKQQWVRSFGGTGSDAASSVQQTADGGYILAGTTNSSGAGGFDVYLVKTDADGFERWSRTFGGTDTDQARAVQQTTDGGYIIAGSTTSFGADSGRNGYLVKTDADGNQQWFQTFGGGGDEVLSSVQQTADGGYIVAGSTTSFGAGGFDAYLVKTYADGNQQWFRTFGGTLTDEASAVQQTADKGYILAGVTDSPEFKAVGFDALLVKTDADGNQQWFQTFGWWGDEFLFSVQQTADGGYILAGQTTSGAVGRDALLVKTDCQGNEESRRTFDLGDVEDVAFSVQQTSDEGYILAGGIRDRVKGATDDVLLIKAVPFARVLPEIATFSANGVEFREISAGNVELMWRVRNASTIRVQRVSGRAGPPSLDMTFDGGSDVTNAVTVQFSLCPFTSCGDFVFRLTATRGCDSAEAHVVVRQAVTAETRRSFEIEAMMVQAFDGKFGQVPYVVSSHPNVQIPDTLNICFQDQGKPIVNPFAGPGVRDDASGLLFYGTFNGVPDRLVGWVYTETFPIGGPGSNPTPPSGLPSVWDRAWFFHPGGWHTADGGMTIWPSLNLLVPPLPFFTVCDRFGNCVEAAINCTAERSPVVGGRSLGPGCSAQPRPTTITHPGGWDMHVFRDPNGGSPQAGIRTRDVGFPDPCSGTAPGLVLEGVNDSNGLPLFPRREEIPNFITP